MSSIRVFGLVHQGSKFINVFDVIHGIQEVNEEGAHHGDVYVEVPGRRSLSYMELKTAMR